MRSLSELIAENDALVRRANRRRQRSIFRLKQSVAKALPRGSTREDVLRVWKAIVDWQRAEAKRGGR